MTISNTKKDEYIFRIIHDLKIPITAQISALQSFLSTSCQKISEEEKDLIELTLNSCNNMQKIIDIFNSVNKLNFESIKLNYEKFDIVNLIKETIKENNILIKYSELNLIFEHKDAFLIYADKLKIKIIIENLLTNAINYARKYSTIQINLSHSKNILTFEIKNESQYIEPEILKEAFHGYNTKTPLYNKSAVGLSLYFCKKIIQAHQGTIFAKSTPDDINIFGFQIPID